ncbi:hypothetical protein Taro_028376 [Colocasia esculenta]|uniref:Uncharacterized protein n=1 Tax=Colocasia esculenta TaxID=4460 RepID=A0A843VH43_COLES|nr:hypothetical protein [Colocasia esculenta]
MMGSRSTQSYSCVDTISGQVDTVTSCVDTIASPGPISYPIARRFLLFPPSSSSSPPSLIFFHSSLLARCLSSRLHVEAPGLGLLPVGLSLTNHPRKEGVSAAMIRLSNRVCLHPLLLPPCEVARPVIEAPAAPEGEDLPPAAPKGEDPPHAAQSPHPDQEVHPPSDVEVPLTQDRPQSPTLHGSSPLLPDVDPPSSFPPFTGSASTSTGGPFVPPELYTFLEDKFGTITSSIQQMADNFELRIQRLENSVNAATDAGSTSTATPPSCTGPSTEAAMRVVAGNNGALNGRCNREIYVNHSAATESSAGSYVVPLPPSQPNDINNVAQEESVLSREGDDECLQSYEDRGYTGFIMVVSTHPLMVSTLGHSP